MDRPEFYRRLAYMTDSTPDKAKKFFHAYDELILEIIATEDEIRTDYATIGGKTKDPQPARGFCRDSIGDEWTYAHFGYPYIKWSKKALDCEKQKGSEYLKERGLETLFRQKYKLDKEKSNIKIEESHN